MRNHKKLGRRHFLKSSGVGLTGLALLPHFDSTVIAQPAARSLKRTFALNHNWLFSEQNLARATQSAVPPQVSCVVERLRQADRWEEAYQVWLNTNTGEIRFQYDRLFTEPSIARIGLRRVLSFQLPPKDDDHRNDENDDQHGNGGRFR